MGVSRLIGIPINEMIFDARGVHLQNWKGIKKIYRGVPHSRGFHYRESHYRVFWLMYVEVGDSCICRGPHTVPLMRISCNAVFFKSQNPHKAGTLCTYLHNYIMQFDDFSDIKTLIAKPFSSWQLYQWPYFSVRLRRHFVNFWVKIEVIKHMLS